MKNILLVTLLSLSFVACSKDKDSCNANSSMIVESSSKSNIRDGLNDQNQLIIYDRQELSASGSTTIVLDGGGSHSSPSDNDEKDDENGVTVLDFSKQVMSSDNKKYKFAEDEGLTASKGYTVYRVDDNQVKKSLEQDMGNMGSDGLKICAIQSASFTFSYNNSTRIAESSFAVVVRTQILDQKLLQYLKSKGN